MMDQNAEYAQYAGPGHWNDPDMLEVGNGEAGLPAGAATVRDVWAKGDLGSFTAHTRPKQCLQTASRSLKLTGQ
jgi:Alpha galactosidase A